MTEFAPLTPATFTERLNNPNVTSHWQTCDRLSKAPGPIVTIFGASGRGKSSLFRDLSGGSASLGSSLQTAGSAIWTKNHRQALGEGIHFTAVLNGNLQEILLVDTPALDTKIGRDPLEHLLPITDLAILAVQITQPAGDEEVSFSSRLHETPAILVLTKCDQADDDDFNEGLEAALAAYQDVPWLAVLVAAADDKTNHEGRNGLPGFHSWCEKAGIETARHARANHQIRLRRSWLEAASAVLDEREQWVIPLWEKAQGQHRRSETFEQTRRLQQEIMRGLEGLPSQALSLYNSQVDSLRVQVASIQEQAIQQLKSKKPLDWDALNRSLTETYTEWNRQVRMDTYEQMGGAIEELKECEEKMRQAYRSAVAEAAREAGTNPLAPVDAHTSSVSRLAVTTGNTLATVQGQTDGEALRGFIVPAVSALGSGALTFGVITVLPFVWPFAPILALAAAGAMAFGLKDNMDQAAVQRQVSDLQSHFSTFAQKQEEQLRRAFREDWNSFCANTRSAITTLGRRIDETGIEAEEDTDVYASLRLETLEIEALRPCLHRFASA